jgi:hypothetical protein
VYRIGSHFWKISKPKNWPSIFLDSHYQKINIARLSHLSSLKLDLYGKNVLELGAGIGDHTLFYLYQNCKVLPIEGRSELTAFIRKRFEIEVKQIDLEENCEALSLENGFDIVHCYGLLYHLNNPASLLEASSKCGKMLILETCVSSDYALDDINLIKEDVRNHSQALHGVGCRPKREWLWNKLSSLYPYVYAPVTQPNHEQFPIDWSIDFPINQLQRSIFIASHGSIKSSMLTELLPKKYSTQ